MPKLEITTSVLKILNRPPRGFFEKIISGILKFIEKYFGSEILIKIPQLQLFQKINNEIFKIINTAYNLQSLKILKKIQNRPKYPDEPFLYNYYVSSEGKAYGAGVDFFNEEKAIWKSIAEATERHLWYNSDNFYKNNFKRTSYKTIKDSALNIFSLAGFSEKQKNKFLHLQFNENTTFNWILANSLILNKKIFLPLQLISAFYCNKIWDKNKSEKNEPMLRWSITTGLATGRNLKEAIVKGILEVIERDAFMISYLNKLSPPIIDLEYLSIQDEEIAKITRDFNRYNLEIYALRLPTDFSGVYIVAVLIIDRTGLGPALSIGANANFDFKTTFLNALSESLIVRYSLKEKFRREINLKNINRETRLIYWSKLKNLPKIDFFLRGSKIKVDLNKNFYTITEDKKYYQEKLKILTNELMTKNYETCYVELTTQEIKKLGLRSVFVVIPELQPLHLIESIPYFGGKRLKEIPLKLGYQPTKELNKIPHPFP